MQKSNSGHFQPVYLVAGKRTPIGSFNGTLSKYSATDLAGFTIASLLKETGISGSQISEVILGNVVSAGVGQAPAKQASFKGGISVDVCSSGMKSIMYGCQSIRLGESQLVIAGGFESMSNAPFYIQQHRRGHTFGDQKLVDGIAFDGLTDSFTGLSMGSCAQKTVKDFKGKLNRKAQDEYGLLSYTRTMESVKNGRFKAQICPVGTMESDQQYLRFNEAKFRTLKPVFEKQTGTITAGNASKLNDGACSVLLASGDKLLEQKLTPLARIMAYADAQGQSVDFCTTPQLAIRKVLSKANLSIQQISYFQINEAFAATVLSNTELLQIPIEKVNVYGGAISLGHPIGMSGARIVLNLAYILRDNHARYGIAAVCNGGGGASAVLLENDRQ